MHIYIYMTELNTTREREGESATNGKITSEDGHAHVCMGSARFSPCNRHGAFRPVMSKQWARHCYDHAGHKAVRALYIPYLAIFAFGFTDTFVGAAFICFAPAAFFAAAFGAGANLGSLKGTGVTFGVTVDDFAFGVTFDAFGVPVDDCATVVGVVADDFGSLRGTRS